MWWQPLVGIGLGLLAAYGLLLAALWRAARRHPEAVRLRDALRLLPDVLRLLRRLVADRDLPPGVRVRVALLAVCLASPVDLVPDVVPVLGYADDAVLLALTLRSVARRAGPAAVVRHWPGSPEGLSAVLRLAGVPYPVARHPAGPDEVGPEEGR